MSWRARCKSFAASLFHRGRMEREMAAELEYHVARHAEDLVRDGVAPAEAARRARLEFGGAAPVEEECRQALGLRFVDETAQDIRYAARMLKKSPGFTAIAVLTLALGIGANTAMFSIVDGWILRPLPYPDSGQLVAISTTQFKNLNPSPAAAADIYDLRKETAVFEQVCAWNSMLFTLTPAGEPQQVSGARVNAEFFDMMGTHPKMGRGFLPEEDQPGAAPVAVIGEQVWQNVFAGDPALVGKTVRIDGHETTVVGIMPAGFHLPLMGRAGVWMPLAFNQADRADRNRRYLAVIARMKPGVRLERAAQYLKTMGSRFEKAYPVTNTGRGFIVNTLLDEIGRHVGKEPTLIVFALVGCVLLLACANVANLIVGRALRRQQEMAVRLAIGAGRLRLLRQLLTENLALFLIAGGLSLALANWVLHWIESSISNENRGFLPNQGAMHVDGAMLLYTLGIAVLMGLIFGFAPAMHCWKVDVNVGLKGASSRATGGSGGTRLKNLLVVAEVSLALLVLVVSGLLVKGLLRMYTINPGFDSKGLVAARLVLSDSKYSDLKRAQAFYTDVVERLRNTSGVKAVGAAQFIPFDGSYRTAQYAIDGQAEAAPQDRPQMVLDAVTPSYFSAIAIALLRGRVLTDQDRAGSEIVGVINETMARRHWAHQDPVGQHIRFGAQLRNTLTIVGVARDVEGQSELDTSRPQAYVSIRQFPTRGMTLLIRTENKANDLAAAIRRAVKEADPGQAVYSVRPMEDVQADTFDPFRIMGEMMTVFGGISVFLAATGIYGVMAYGVAARKKEFGIRMALGAGRGDLVAMVAAQGMKLTSAGFAIGLVSAVATTRFMSSLLYRVSPTDLPTFLMTSLLMLLVAAFACYLPARQASSVDPMRALHHE